MKATILAFIICLVLVWPAVAQDSAPLSPAKPQDLTDAKPSNCAYRTASLDGITQQAAADELIIVIARSGEGDTRPGLNRRRLHNVRAYWWNSSRPGTGGGRRLLSLPKGSG